MFRRHMARAVVCGVVALALAGCTLPFISPAATTLQVTRSSPRLPALSVSITTASRVGALFQAVKSLRQVPAGTVFFCPIDFGTQYHLAFSRAGASPTRMTMSGSGCRFIRVEPSGPTYFQTDNFRALFSQVTGISPLEYTPGG